MKQVISDGGRSRYTAIPSRHDCVVRAVALAANLDYQGVYTRLRSIAPALETEGINIHGAAFIHYMRHLGFIRVEGVTTMQDIPKGRVIACTGGHYTAILDGVIYDTRNESDRPVTHYWVQGRLFDLYRAGKKLNSSPLNAAAALNMRRLYTLNYGFTCSIAPNQM